MKISTTKMTNLRSRKGFTLVELLVVIAIMAILSVTAYTAFGGQTVKARDARRLQDLNAIQSMLEIYNVNEGRYPTVLESGLVTDGKVPKKYLSIIPTDPGRADPKHTYVYTLGAGNLTYELATTLERGNDLSKYESYVIGNDDNGISKTLSSDGKWYDATGDSGNGSLEDCSVDSVVITAKIGTSVDTNCIPYDPNN